MLRKNRWSIAWGAAAATLAIAGCSRPSAEPPKAPTAREIKPVAVRIVEVTREEVQRVTTQPATVHALHEAEMRARVNGYVEKVTADIGDVVKKGATLAVISVPEMEKRSEIIEARITRFASEEQRAQAGVELAKAGVRSAEAQLEQAKSELKSADAALAAMQAEFQRTEDLVQRQSLERRVLDEVRKKRDSARANREALAAAILSAEAERTSSLAVVQAAQAETAIARRQLEELDILLGYAIVKAPFDGVVTTRVVETGDLVGERSEAGAGQTLFVVSQVSKVRVRIPVPETDAALVRRGDAMSLRFPSFPEEASITTTVRRVAGGLDPSTRTMLVEAEWENADHKLLPGMFGQATITLGAKVPTNVLPARAVRFSESGEAYIYVVDNDNVVTVTPVQTGFDNGSLIEVKQGLEAGQRVIDAHLQRFETDQRVVSVRK